MYCWNWKRFYRRVFRCKPSIIYCVDCRNKILVQAVELAKGPHTAEQKKALEGMNVWKRVIDENKEMEPISDDEMEIDT